MLVKIEVGESSRKKLHKENKNVTLNCVNNIAETHFTEIIEPLGRISSRYIKKHTKKILFLSKIKSFTSKDLLSSYIVCLGNRKPL